jgi:DNA-binding PadR family transcriptional regulator
MTDTPPPPSPSGETLPATAYAVLGILSVHDEELSPAEIKVRAAFSLEHFYWSPAVSHIRRELRRLLELGYVREREIPIGKVRTSQVYQSTDEGERALAGWVSDSSPEESVVVKNSVLLRVFLGDKAPPETVITVIDSRLAEVEQAIREHQWGARRSLELGVRDAANLRYPRAVTDYVLRSLYFEQSNLRQLRDSVLAFDTVAFKHDDSIRRMPLHPRGTPGRSDG